MSPHRIACELVVLAVLCVLAIFLFPAAQGPYSVVNGPVTALQAARAAARLRKVMQSVSRSSSRFRTSHLVLFAIAARNAEDPLAPLLESTAVLRC